MNTRAGYVIESAGYINSKRKFLNGAYIAVLFLTVQIISLLTPPFQSPDEYAHVYRAHLFSRGDVFLGEYEIGSATGGEVDSGLVSYMSSFLELSYAGGFDNRLNESILRASKKVHWSGQDVVVSLANTATYFPLAYAPQALALFIGEHSGFSVNTSYYLARQAAIFTAIGLLWAAMSISPVPLAVLALFSMPMVLMQIASASLDGVAFGLTGFVAAIFWRMLGPGFKYQKTFFWILILSVFSLVTTRVNLIPLVALPLFIYLRNRSFYIIAGFSILTLSCAGWVAFTVKTVKGVTPAYFAPNLIYELTHPIYTIVTLADQVFSSMFVYHMTRMFLGVAGWHYSLLTPFQYGAVLLFVIGLVASEPKLRKLRGMSLRSCGILLLALASCAMIFMIFLATNPLEAPSLSGLQGRYFIPPFILIFFVLSIHHDDEKTWLCGRVVALYILLLLSGVFTSSVILERFWLGHDYSNRILFSSVEESGKSIPLTSGHTFSQYFDSQGKSASKLTLMLDSPVAQDSMELRISLFDSKGVLIYAADKEIKHINGRQWVDIPLDYFSYVLIKGERYRIDLQTLTGKAGAVRIFLAAPTIDSAGSSALMDGNPLDHSFNFKLEFLK